MLMIFYADVTNQGEPINEEEEVIANRQMICSFWLKVEEVKPVKYNWEYIMLLLHFIIF